MWRHNGKRFSLLHLPMKVQITMAKKGKASKEFSGLRWRPECFPTTPGIKSERKKSRKVEHK